MSTERFILYLMAGLSIGFIAGLVLKVRKAENACHSINAEFVWGARVLDLCYRYLPAILKQGENQMRTVLDDDGSSWTRTSKCENCVEVSVRGDHVMIRDSNEPSQHIRVPFAEFLSFVAGVKQGDFDNLK